MSSLRVNYKANASVQFEMLSPDQSNGLLQAALQELELNGMRPHDPRAMHLLAREGLERDTDGQVRVPSWLVLRALETAPKWIRVAGRDRSHHVVLGAGRACFASVAQAHLVKDARGEGNTVLMPDDAGDHARLVDALPQIDVCGSYLSDDDIAGDRLLALLRGTTKPLLLRVSERTSLQLVYEMACVAVGGEKALWLLPPVIAYVEAGGNQARLGSAQQSMFFAAEKGIPVAFAPVLDVTNGQRRAHSQVLVQHMAACLAALMLVQLERPGAPVFLPVTPLLQDEGSFRSAAAPQVVQATAALSDVAKRLGLPAIGWGGCSDSKVFDQQAVIESAVSLALGGLSGAGLVMGAGGLESGHLLSRDMLVLANEIISMCRHIYRGITVDAEHLAVDVIHRVGPGGNFLAEEHTLQHFRTQHWFPELLQRTSYAAWEAGGARTLSERARDKVVHLLQTHTAEAMTDEAQSALRRIAAAGCSSDRGKDVSVPA